MLVKHINVVGSQTVQRGVDDVPDVCGAAVETDCFAVAVDLEPKFGGYQNVITDWLERLSDVFLVDVGAVSIGGVEKGDAAFGGGPDDGQCFGPVGRAIEPSALSRQGLPRRIQDPDTLTHELGRWREAANAVHLPVRRQFTTDGAMVRLRPLYPGN